MTHHRRLAGEPRPALLPPATPPLRPCRSRLRVAVAREADSVPAPRLWFMAAPLPGPIRVLPFRRRPRRCFVALTDEAVEATRALSNAIWLKCPAIIPRDENPGTKLMKSAIRCARCNSLRLNGPALGRVLPLKSRPSPPPDINRECRCTGISCCLAGGRRRWPSPSPSLS